MVTDIFSSILAEIGQALGVSNLHPDQTNSCLIKFPSGVSIQINMDGRGEALIIGSELGIVQPGRYRENVFREALKANGMPPPLNGILAFSKKADKLILFEKVPIKDFHIEIIRMMMPDFLEKAKTWRDALARGDVPAGANASSSSSSSGMFGLRR